MWWFRAGPAAAILALAACGFTPVYGPGGVAEGLRGQIAVEPPRDPASYALVRALEGRLGDGQAPLYALDAAVALDQEGLGVTPDQEITRIQVAGQLDYTLTDIETGALLDRGSVSSFTAYSAPVFSVDRNSIAGNSVTVRAAREDAVERLMVILADQLTSRLIATAPRWRQ